MVRFKLEYPGCLFDQLPSHSLYLIHIHRPHPMHLTPHPTLWIRFAKVSLKMSMGFKKKLPKLLMITNYNK